MGEKRNIVICCDGTGNVYGEENSNVVKLYATLEINAGQIGYYHPGVGTMGAPSANNKVEEEWSIIKGLAFGAGLMPNVGDAYRYLMNNYRGEDDNIFIFGFSRGAYTARALAGMLQTYGLLCPGNEGLIPYVTRMYKRASHELQRQGAHTFDVAHGFRKTYGREVKLHFVGVWDTVSSVGWIYDPVKLLYTARNPIMRIGRHAVSIDERRCFFRDNLWGEPMKPGDRYYDFDQPQDIKQVFFAGVHCDVGGSYPEFVPVKSESGEVHLRPDSGLSKLALEWMLREASLAGLKIKEDYARVVLGRMPLPPDERLPYCKPDPAGTMHKSLSGPWWIAEFVPHQYWDKDTKQIKHRIPMGAPRQIPLNDDRIIMHESVQQRLNDRPDYQPPNLPSRNLKEHFKIEPRIEFPAANAATP